MTIKTSPIRMLVLMLSLIGALLCANLAGVLSKYFFGHDYVFGLIPLFDLNTEKNIPTAYATLQLIFSSALLAFIGINEKAVRKNYFYWFALAVLFAFLAFDEQFQVHERLISPMRDLVSAGGVFHYAWIIPYGIATVVIIILFSKFVLSLPKKTARLFVVSGAMFLGGALGLEMVGGLIASNGNRETLIYAMTTTSEELLELVAIALFVYSLLCYASDHDYSLQLVVKD